MVYGLWLRFGFGVSGFGFQVWGLGLRIYLPETLPSRLVLSRPLRLGIGDSGFGIRVSGLGFMDQGSRFRNKDSGFMVLGFGFWL